MLVVSATGFDDQTDPPGLLAVANSIARTIDSLIPGPCPLGERPIQIILGTRPRVIWNDDDIESGSYRIMVTSRIGFWNQFAFQLSHELAHVKMGPARSNLLIEVLATSVSLESLFRLQTAWSSAPPFPWAGWPEYASQLSTYRTEALAEQFDRLPTTIRNDFGQQTDVEMLHRLQSVQPAIKSLPLTHSESRAWQHAAANILLRDVLLHEQDRWADLIGLATHTNLPPCEVRTYRCDLDVIDADLPAWMPSWLR